MKILLTGGHITPALAVIEEIRQRYPGWSVVLIGRHHALDGVRVISEEKRLAIKFDIPFRTLTTGRITRVVSFWTVLSLLKIPIGFIQSLWFITTIRPDIIISFGGYIALPIVLVGKLLRVPIITHEQTRVSGLANRILSFFADRVCVSFSDQKGIYTGLPIRKEIFGYAKKPNYIDAKRPLLFFSGGSTGSRSLNEIIFHCIPNLTKRFMIVHQTGRISKTKQRKYYVPLPYIDVPDYAWIIQHAKLVIGRSGANTVGEVAALGKVAIWIPLPWSGGGEQWENARYLEERGTSVVINQSAFTPEVLQQSIEQIISRYDEYKKNAQALSGTMKRGAASRLVDVIEEVITDTV